MEIFCALCHHCGEDDHLYEEEHEEQDDLDFARRFGVGAVHGHLVVADGVRGVAAGLEHQKITDFHITEKTGQNTRTGRFVSRFFSKGEVICS